jgi:putative MATE family efflux protein
MERVQDFTRGKILKPLLKFALPVFLALFLQAMYGAVDLMVVGRFAGTADVSGVATGTQVIQSVTFVLSSLASGVTILLGQTIGKKQQGQAGRIIGSSIILFAILALVFTALFLALAEPISKLLQAPREAFSETLQYIRICAAGLIFVTAFNLLGSIFRGIGDSTMPLITVAIACVVNIFGDLLLVAVFHMGAAGAADATIFAQAVSVLLSVLIIVKRKLPFSFGRKDIRLDGKIIRQILHFGVPIAFQDFLVSISFLVILAIINSLGLLQSAGVGIAEKVCAFLMLAPSAFSQSLSAFVAQNYGANKPVRMRKALGCGILSSLLVGIVMGWLAFFHGSALAGIFENDASVTAMAADYLRAYGIDCILVSVLFCFSGYFNGMGRTIFVMIQGIIGAFCVRIPAAYFISRIPHIPLFCIGLATPASTILQITMCGIYDMIIRRREKLQAVKQTKAPPQDDC